MNQLIRWILVFVFYFQINISKAFWIRCFRRPDVRHDDGWHDGGDVFPSNQLACKRFTEDEDADTTKWPEIESQWNIHRSCVFAAFNQRIRNSDDATPFLKMASITEYQNQRLHQAQQNVIVYHGETVPVWLFQRLAREVRYPAVKDWLPLRFVDRYSDTDSYFLKQLLKQGNDYKPNFAKAGMSAHVNLFSWRSTESATCAMTFDWDRRTGYSNQRVQDFIDPFTTSPVKSEQIESRINAMLLWIGWRMKWTFTLSRMHTLKFRKIKYSQLFPSLKTDELSQVKLASERYSNSYHGTGVGIILQISMPPKLAETYCYASGPYGKPKSEHFLEYYSKHKNRLDNDGQLRIAMGYPFTRYPSPVKIKALSPLFQDEQLIQLLDKMIQDTARFINTR